jgi:hypothetical protein
MSNDQYLDQEPLLPVQRSTFLTVLCVLTFLGSAYGIFSGLTSIMQAEKMATEIHKSMNDVDKDREKARKDLEKVKGKKGANYALEMFDSMSSLTAGDFKKAGGGAIVANVLTLLGALLMWRLNRIGFFVYIAGIVASIAIPYFVFGSSNFMFLLSAMYAGFFGVIFIAMYAFNVRDMK